MKTEKGVKFETITFHKSSEEFKEGFRFAMRCLLDMVKHKDESYTMADHIRFLSDFLRVEDLVNRKTK